MLLLPFHVGILFIFFSSIHVMLHILRDHLLLTCAFEEYNWILKTSWTFCIHINLKLKYYSLGKLDESMEVLSISNDYKVIRDIYLKALLYQDKFGDQDTVRNYAVFNTNTTSQHYIPKLLIFLQ